MSRRLAREVAMKLVFQVSFSALEDQPIDDYIESYSEMLSPNNIQYVRKVAAVIKEDLAQIDAYINDYSENWKIDRLGRVDLSILRVAIAEMLFFEDIPYGVSINEAVELAKAFSTNKAPGYINGILDKIHNHLVQKAR